MSNSTLASHSRPPLDDYRVCVRLEDTYQCTSDVTHDIDSVRTVLFGEIYFDFGSKGAKPIGTFSGYAINLADIINHDLDAFEVFDCVDQPLFDVYAALFNKSTNWLLKKAENWGPLEPYTLMYIDEMKIEKKHRGRDVGLIAMRQFLASSIVPNLTLVVIKPCPIEPYDSQPLQAAATRVLRLHWSKAGFRQFKKTDYYLYFKE